VQCLKSKITTTLSDSVQSGATVPVVHAHVFSKFFKGLVDLKVEMAWYQYRHALASREELKKQFAPQGAAATGVKQVTGQSESKTILLQLLFRAPPASPAGLSQWLGEVFTDDALPVCSLH
jgi:hypothetical protein